MGDGARQPGRKRGSNEAPGGEAPREKRRMNRGKEGNSADPSPGGPSRDTGNIAGRPRRRRESRAGEEEPAAKRQGRGNVERGANVWDAGGRDGGDGESAAQHDGGMRGVWNTGIRGVIEQKNKHFQQKVLAGGFEAKLKHRLEGLDEPAPEGENLRQLWMCLTRGGYTVTHDESGEGPLLGAGAVIELPEGIWWPCTEQSRRRQAGGNKLYVRECYNHVVNHMLGQKEHESQRHIGSFGLSGTAGIGKTFLMGYVLFVLARCKVTTILVQSKKDLYLIHADAVHRIKDEMLREFVASIAPFHLADGNERTICHYWGRNTEKLVMHFCSFQKDVFNEDYVKAPYADMMYLALWTEEELVDCGRKVYNQPEENICKKFFFFGGNARAIFAQQGPWAAVENALGKVEKTPDFCLLAWRAEMSTESDKLFYMDVIPREGTNDGIMGHFSCKCRGCIYRTVKVPGSAAIVDELMKMALTMRDASLEAVVEDALHLRGSPAYRGVVFENAFHLWAKQKVQASEAVKIIRKAVGTQDRAEEESQSMPMKGGAFIVEENKGGTVVEADGYYHLPRTFPTIDGFLWKRKGAKGARREMTCFQVTTAKSRREIPTMNRVFGTSVVKFEEGVASGTIAVDIAFYYVVPKGHFESFTARQAQASKEHWNILGTWVFEWEPSLGA